MPPLLKRQSVPDFLSNIPADRMPRHVAVIMDGNGRWATGHGLSRVDGHVAGAKVVPGLVKHAAGLRERHGGPDVITLYSFSLENRKRPPEEVGRLMNLHVQYLIEQRPLLVDNNVCFRHLGRLEDLPEQVAEELAVTLDLTRHNTGLTLNLALAYGGRGEIVDAVRRIAEAAAAGHLDPASIDEETFEAHLYTAGQPDVDLLIRTAGEMRVSNYLLWQISYAEMVVLPVLWPDFTTRHFDEALRAFTGRKRRFGALDPSAAR
ncbi:MAG: polyprenyl diphosphate synthase [Phycisphaerae bacterium]